MARVTVEDCVDKITNRFDLVIMAAQRARAVSSGAEITVERDGDKNPVVALREIADETVALPELEEAVVRSHQKHIEPDEPGEDEVDLHSMQRELMGEMPIIDDSGRGEDELPSGMMFEDDSAAMDDDGGMMQQPSLDAGAMAMMAGANDTPSADAGGEGAPELTEQPVMPDMPGAAEQPDIHSIADMPGAAEQPDIPLMPGAPDTDEPAEK